MPQSQPLPAITIKDLSAYYTGQDEPAIGHINLEIHGGHIYGIIGPNGAGKSTLIKAIMGLIPVQQGAVQCHGKSVNAQRRKIAYIPQRSSVDWNFPITVREVVQLGLFPDLKRFEFFTPKRHKEITAQALHQLGLNELANRQISKLSGGQQQRMFIARALAQSMMPDGADIFLMDEPFTGIDAATEKDLITIIKALAKQGKAIIAVHHNLSTVPDIFTDVILINRMLISAGSVEKVFTEDLIKQTFLPPFTLSSKTSAAI
jgi:ABC-type Mn2+/Zn2+ transport system ATPase subunit